MKRFMILSVTRICSGVVGWEHMGTAFPHEKLSGNAAHNRNFEILLLLLLNKLFPTVTTLQHSVHLKPCHIWTSEFAKYLEH